MKRLFRNLSIFLLPYMVFLALPAWKFIHGGELGRLDHIIQRQAEDRQKMLLGLEYSSPETYYKYQMILKAKPELLAMGSSRILQFRKEEFKQDARFYNAGRLPNSTQDLLHVIKLMPENIPVKTIILSLDQHWFNAGQEPYPSDEKDLLEYQPDYSKIISNAADVYRQLISDYMHPGNPCPAPPDIVAEGLIARRFSSGYRNDGSYWYGQKNRDGDAGKLNDGRFKSYEENLYHGLSPNWCFGKTISAQAVVDMDSFLAVCHRRNIDVIAYLPPFSSHTYNYMLKEGRHSYIFKVYDALLPIFRRYGYDLFDLTENEKEWGYNDEYVDAVHGSEKMYLKILMWLCSHSAVLDAYCDRTFLQEKLERCKSHFSVFDE